MAIAPGRAGADPAETPDGERVIVPTSIYAPGTLVDAPPDGDGAATAGYQAAPGYSPPPAPSGMPGPDPGMGQPVSPDYGPPPPPDGAPAGQPGEHPYGDYAYVIREEEAPAPRPPRSRATGPGMGSPVDQPPPQEPAEPATAYGPGDPAYGPPSPEWYTEDHAEPQAAEEPHPIRGVFEPPANQGVAGEEDPGDDRPPLEKIRNFYLTAEANAENLDGQFDELLERQRQLISAYFTQAAPREDPR